MHESDTTPCAHCGEPINLKKYPPENAGLSKQGKKRFGGDLHLTCYREMFKRPSA